jgi:thiol:disulfide interchange protein
MKKGFLFALAAAAALIIACNQPTATDTTNKGGDAGTEPVAVDSSMSEIAWVKEDFASALQQADADGKLLMIDVYTVWCAPCKAMDKNTFPDKQVVDKAANFVSLKLDAEKGQGPEVAKKYGVIGFPTILFVNGKGELVHSVDAYQSPEALVAEMDKALNKA